MLHTLDYEKWKNLLREEAFPTAIVDLDAFDRNQEKLAQLVKPRSKSLRIATKSIRVPELLQRILKRGPPFAGLMAYSAQEALCLSRQGMDDFLLAYPTIQRSDLRKLREIHEGGGKVSVVVDCAEAIVALATSLRNVSRPFPVVIDVDVSLRLLKGRAHLGVRRSPIRSAGALRSLMAEIQKHPQLKLVGAMAYEAQVAGLGDRNPFKPWLNPVAKIVRRLSVESVAKFRKEIAETFQTSSVPLEIFNGGGTGSITFATEEPWLTEVTAGSALFCPHLFDYFSNVHFEPACFFALQVVRRSDPDFVTCQGGGYIASGEPSWDRLPQPHSPLGLSLVQAEVCGEVQTPLKNPRQISLKIGDPVIFRHAKAGELAEHFNDYLLVSQARIVGRAKTYRGMGWGFG